MIAKALLATCLVAFASDALASITLSQSVVVNNATNMVDFEIEFATPPDFFTEDSAGRQADGFIYEFYDKQRNGLVVASVEIPNTGMIFLRESELGHLVQIYDPVPYTLNSNVLTFSVDQSLFTGGAKPERYRYLSVLYGSPQTELFVNPVPEASSLLVWSVLGVCIGSVMLRWKRAGQA